MPPPLVLTVALAALGWTTLAHLFRARWKADPVRVFLAVAIGYGFLLSVWARR